MALEIRDRIKETCTGTNGDMALTGAVAGFVGFDLDATLDGDTIYYCLVDADGTKWEVGLGTLSADSTSIARTTILSTQVSFTDTTRQTFSGGTHTIFATYPASKSVYLDASGVLSHSIVDADISGSASIANSKLANSSVSFGGVSVALGSSDATPAFDLSDATNYPTSSLSGTITNAQLAGSIANAKLANDSVSFGGITLALGASDATPAFDLSDATNYATSNLSGTITNAQLAGSIANAKLANDSVSFGGVTVALGASDATPAFDLSDATNYPTSSLSGTITNAQLAGSIANAKLVNDGITIAGTDTSLGGSITADTIAGQISVNTIAFTQIADLARGSILYGNNSAETAELTKGSANTVLQSDGTDISWGTVSNAMLAGSIANAKLANDSVSFGGITVALGASDATPAFDLSDATNYPTSSLSGTITNAQLAGSIANAKLANDSVSFGGITVALGASDATPAFDLADATNYPTSSLSGTITNAQLAGSIANAKLANDSVSFGGITVALGASDATPAFDLSDATNYPTSSLSGTITNAQLAGSIANAKLANSAITVAAGSDSTAISLGGTMTFAGTANEVEVTESSGTVTIGLPSSITADLTGDVTGNVSGSAATVTGAAQSSITSLGTLTTLTVDNITIDASTIDFNGTTGNNKLELTDNLASALDVTESSNSYMKFVTTNSAESITTSKNIVQHPDMGNTALTGQSGSVVINANLGSYFTVATTGNITGLDIQNAVVGQKILIRFAWGGDHSLAFTDTVAFPGNTPPGTTASGVDVIGFVCTTASTHFDGFIVGEDLRSS